MFLLINSLLAQTRPLDPTKNEIVNDVPTLKGLEGVFENVIVIILGLAGIILFIMLLSGGFKYITAGGDPKGMEGAKKTLTYAIGGIVVVALSYLILNLIQEFTGANVTVFKVFQTPTP